MKEDELCAWFIDLARSHGWVCYPETSGWDILLVRNGIQIGVQAKTRANIKILEQALPETPHFRCNMMSSPDKFRGCVKGPDFRSVLVPEEKIGKKTFKYLDRVCRVTGLWMFAKGKPRKWGHSEPYHYGTGLLDDPEHMHEYDWQPPEKEWIPDVVPDLPAGVPNPVALTKWKQKALRLIARAEIRGWVTSKDAKELDVNFSTFKGRWNPWMKCIGKTGRFNKYALCGDDPKRPDRQCPDAYRHFLEEVRNEMENDDDLETEESD